MPIQRDISGIIARWLFRLGIIWAVILAPITIFLFLPFLGGKSLWQLGIYCLMGFAVWLGWRWRSHQRPTLRVAAAFWLFSAAYNSTFVIYMFAIGPRWTRILIYDQTAFFAWWSIAATLASLSAFAFEFTLQRHEIHTRPDS